MVGRLVVFSCSNFWPFKFNFLYFLFFWKIKEKKGNCLKADLSTLKSVYWSLRLKYNKNQHFCQNWYPWFDHFGVQKLVFGLFQSWFGVVHNMHTFSFCFKRSIFWCILNWKSCFFSSKIDFFAKFWPSKRVILTNFRARIPVLWIFNIYYCVVQKLLRYYIWL